MGEREEREAFESYLRDRGQKMTEARETVLRAFLDIERHVTAEELVAACKTLNPNIGQATVFRTINLLAEAGLAREACRDDGARQFEHAWHHAHHDHLVCEDCGAVVEFVDEAIETAQDAIYRAYGYVSVGHRLELRGRCPECAAKR